LRDPATYWVAHRMENWTGVRGTTKKIRQQQRDELRRSNCLP
jgi:hypothetical protein